MSEATRYKTPVLQEPSGNLVKCADQFSVVHAHNYDVALIEISTLQVDLADAQADIDTIADHNIHLQEMLTAAQSELAALREELATTSIDLSIEKAAHIQSKQRLKSAEERNSELSALLRRASAFTHDLLNPISLRRDINAALKPTESGASDAERKEDDRWLQMKDDQERADYFDESGASE